MFKVSLITVAGFFPFMLGFSQSTNGYNSKQFVMIQREQTKIHDAHSVEEQLHDHSGELGVTLTQLLFLMKGLYLWYKKVSRRKLCRTCFIHGRTYDSSGKQVRWTCCNCSNFRTLSSDGSLIGWGATSQGKSTGGIWVKEEKSVHLNVLELKAVELAIRTFINSHANRQHIRPSLPNKYGRNKEPSHD